METTLLAWILVFPLAGALSLAALRNRFNPRMIGIWGSVTVGLSFAATILALVQRAGASGDALVQRLFVWAEGTGFMVDFGFLGDAIALWWLLVITGVGFFIHVYATEYMRDDPSVGRFFAQLNYFVFSMSLLVLADNFVGLLIGWAQVGLASFMLIGFWHDKSAAAEASKKAFVINYAGEASMIVALLLIFSHFRSFAFADVFAAVGDAPVGLMTAIALLLLVGAIAKSAQLPLHTWLPDAMQGPTPVSALMHAATMVTAGVYLVTRSFPIFLASDAAMQTVAVVGAVTALFGAVVATRQCDIKRVLAFSTMSQLGYMMLGAGVGAYTASVFHFFTHAFFKALLFLGAGMVARYLHGEQDIRRMGGLGRAMPFARTTFLIGVLAIVGAPPLAGFFSKDEILGVVLGQGHSILWLIGLVTAGLTAFYMTRLFALVFTGRLAEAAAQPDFQGRDSGGAMRIPMAVLAVLAIGAGMIAIPGVLSVPADFLDPAFALYGHVVPHAGIDWSVAAVMLIAAAGAWIGIRWYGPAGTMRPREIASIDEPRRDPIRDGLYLDPIIQRGVGGLFVGLGTVVAGLLEPYVIDGSVNGIAYLAKQAGRGLKRMHSGFVRRYALALFAGFALFLIYFILI